MKHRAEYGCLAVAAALLCAVVLSLCLGAVPLSLPTLWETLRRGAHDTAGYIFWYSRLPRTGACVLAGAGLAVTVCCAWGVVSGWVYSCAAFGGALAAVAAVMLLARKTGASRSTVLLSGVAINSILNALRDAVTTLVPDVAALGSDFRTGGFSAVSLPRLLPAAALIALALAAAFCLSTELELLGLGEETAQSLGLPVRRTRAVLLALAAVLAGAAVSFAGLLSFVGLVVPHMVRQLTGSECRRALPLCALGGALLVTVCDLLSRLVFAPFELPVGIVISMLGGPFFLALLLRRRGGKRHA